MLIRNRLAFAAASALLLGLIAACSGDRASDGQYPVAMAPLENMPPAVQRSAKSVRQAYQFAVANPDILSRVPCYCGCGGMGHTSVHSCYVSVTPEGATFYEGHALGCSICVDIALDAMRLMKQGKGTAEIKLYVDVMYSKYGSSNMS